MSSSSEKQPEESEQSLMENIADSIQSKDEPIEKNHPTAPFAIVTLTYPVLIILAILVLGVIYYFSR